MKSLQFLVLIVALLLAVSSFAFSFWPLSMLAIALLVFYGHTALGIMLGLFLDVLFGAPTGMFHFLHFPFFLLSILCVGLRILAVSFLLEKGGMDAL